MVTPAVGEVVLVRFPFSDLSQSKLRPAVCLADAGRGDWVLCQITSNAYGDSRAIWFTAHERLIAKSVGKLRDDTLGRVVDAVVALLRMGIP